MAILLDFTLREKGRVDANVLRKIRCLGEGGHQAVIITINPNITLCKVAEKMFSHWSRENFFKFLILDFDNMIQYGTQSVEISH